MKKGLWVVVDGIDGIGKGTIERTLREIEEKEGKAVFDSIAFAQAWDRPAEIKDIWGIPRPQYHVIMTAEPTYTGIGKTIREEIIKKNGRHYSPETQAQTYAIDREIQMKCLTLPTLELGLTIIQSRSCVSSLVYQTQTAKEDGTDPLKARERILALEGNQFQLKNAPDLIIIPTIGDMEKLMARISGRIKDDQAIFDNKRFQTAIKGEYESAWLKELLASKNIAVAYLDAGISEEETRRQAREIYQSFRNNRNVPEKYN